MSTLEETLKGQLSIVELRHDLGKYILTAAGGLFGSGTVRVVIAFLAAFCLAYPIWQFIEAFFLRDLILLSVPHFFLLVVGAILGKAALYWGRRVNDE